MGLHISLAGDSSRGPFQPIYIGESGAAARDAEAKCRLPWLLRIDNPPVLRKHNSNVSEVVASVAPLDVAEVVATPAEQPLRPRRK